MTAEIAPRAESWLGRDHQRFVSAAEHVMEAPESRVLSDFMWRFVGSPDALRRHIEGVPPVSRQSVEGREVNYREVLASGYTRLGYLVHVRINHREKDPRDKYLVVIGDLKEHILYEDLVAAERHELHPQKGLITTLYLTDTRDGSWERDFLPQVVLTGEGMYFCPGYEHRPEQLEDVGELVADCQQYMSQHRLAIVPDVSQ